MNKVYEKTETMINYETGEVTQEVNISTRKVKADKFIQVYIEDLSRLYDLNESEFKVLVYLWKIAEFNTNRIVLHKAEKERISKQVKKSFSSITRSIMELKKKGILGSKKRLEYMINPKYFFKGEQAKRNKIIKVFMEYHII